MFSPNRREFLTGAAALGAYAALGRGVDGTRVGTRRGGHPLCEVADLGKSARDYVQDGLICMWDAIENVGWKTHDPNATVWKDLTGNGYDMTLTSSGMFTPDAITRKDFDNPGVATIPSISNIVSYEFVFSLTTFITEQKIYNNPSWWGGTGPFFVGWGNNAIKINGLGNGLGFKIESGVRYLFSASTTVYKNSRECETLYHSYVLRSPTELLYGGSQQLSGEFCCIRNYNREITAAEVAHNYAIDRARFNLP